MKQTVNVKNVVMVVYKGNEKGRKTGLPGRSTPTGKRGAPTVGDDVLGVPNKQKRRGKSENGSPGRSTPTGKEVAPIVGDDVLGVPNKQKRRGKSAPFSSINQYNLMLCFLV